MRVLDAGLVLRINLFHYPKSRKTIIMLALLKQVIATLLLAKDGRISESGKKVCFGYQLVALRKFGKENLVNATPTKSEKQAFTISHLCGTRNCCLSSHIVLELKSVNDERVHCHFALKNLKSSSSSDDLFVGVRHFLESGGCPHYPLCGQLDDQDFDSQE